MPHYSAQWLNLTCFFVQTHRIPSQTTSWSSAKYLCWKTTQPWHHPLLWPGWFFTYRWCWWTLLDLLTGLNRNLKSLPGRNLSQMQTTSTFPPVCVCLRRDVLVGFPPLSDFPFPLSSWIMLLEQQGDSPILRRYTEFHVLFIAEVKVNNGTLEKAQTSARQLIFPTYCDLHPKTNTPSMSSSDMLLVLFSRVSLGERIADWGGRLQTMILIRESSPLALRLWSYTCAENGYILQR